MQQFNIGDVVERITAPKSGMQVGSRWTVTNTKDFGHFQTIQVTRDTNPTEVWNGQDADLFKLASTGENQPMDENDLMHVPLSARELHVIMQALLDAPYIGLSRPTDLANALGAVTDAAIAAGTDWEAIMRGVTQSFSPHVWTEVGYEPESAVQQ